MVDNRGPGATVGARQGLRHRGLRRWVARAAGHTARGAEHHPPAQCDRCAHDPPSGLRGQPARAQAGGRDLRLDEDRRAVPQDPAPRSAAGRLDVQVRYRRLQPGTDQESEPGRGPRHDGLVWGLADLPPSSGGGIQEARAVPDAPRASAPPSSRAHRRAADQGQRPSRSSPHIAAGTRRSSGHRCGGEIVSGLAVILVRLARLGDGLVGVGDGNDVVVAGGRAGRDRHRRLGPTLDAPVTSTGTARLESHMSADASNVELVDRRFVPSPSYSPCPRPGSSSSRSR